MSQAGFTLVEILTVLVIIGLVSNAVVLTLPQDKAAIETYAKILARDANVLAQDSLLSGVPSALGLSNDGYAVMRFEEGEWVVLREMPQPGDFVVRFEKDEVSIDLTDEVLPLIIFEPTGQATVFSLTLSSPEQSYSLISKGDGRVILESGL